MCPPPSAAPEFQLSLVDDPLLRLQRLLRIAPRQGLGVVRRAVLLALLTWLPIAVWALLNRRWLASIPGEPLLSHFGVHARCLVGIPLLILAEAPLSGLLGRIFPHFAKAGLVSEAEQASYAAILKSAARWRDSWITWSVIAGLTVVSALSGNFTAEKLDALNWAIEGRSLGFGGLWYLYVARPVALLLTVVWVWRILLLAGAFRRLARLDLQLVPGHPDGVGGLSFLEYLPLAFAGFSLSIAAVLAGGAAHNVVYHKAHVQSFLPLAVAALVVVPGLVLAPLLMFSPALRRVRLRARLQYDALSGRFGRALHQRWIEGKTIADDILQAPELGPAADVATLYTQITAMRPTPIGKKALLSALAPVAVPALLVAAIEVPVKDALLQLLKALL
jgi:hypothetical protein